jgi:hypothetical protein
MAQFEGVSKGLTEIISISLFRGAGDFQSKGYTVCWMGFGIIPRNFMMTLDDWMHRRVWMITATQFHEGWK